MAENENKIESAGGKKQVLTVEMVKFIFYIITLAIIVMVFYGAFDKRVTVIESDMKHKVDSEQLFQKLDEVKKEIGEKIEKEIQKIKR